MTSAKRAITEGSGAKGRRSAGPEFKKKIRVVAVLWSSSGQFRAMTVPDCFGSLSGWGGPKSERRARSVSEAQTRLGSAVIRSASVTGFTLCLMTYAKYSKHSLKMMPAVVSEFQEMGKLCEVGIGLSFVLIFH